VKYDAGSRSIVVSNVFFLAMLFNMAQHCWNLEVGVSNDQIRAICAINAYLIIGLSGGLVFFFPIPSLP